MTPAAFGSAFGTAGLGEIPASLRSRFDDFCDRAEKNGIDRSAARRYATDRYRRFGDVPRSATEYDKTNTP